MQTLVCDEGEQAKASGTNIVVRQRSAPLPRQVGYGRRRSGHDPVDGKGLSPVDKNVSCLTVGRDWHCCRFDSFPWWGAAQRTIPQPINVRLQRPTIAESCRVFHDLVLPMRVV
jgi:hypothetical protein